MNQSFRNIVIILLFAVFFAQCAYFAWDNGQTVDETFYTGSAYPIVRHNSYKVLGEHPPLTMQLAGLPLLFLQPQYKLDDPIYIGDSNEIDIHRMGSRMLYGLGNDAKQILFLERFPNILLAVLLGLTLLFWSKELSGWGGALLSLALFAFSPNMVSNAGQFMTDMAVTVFFFLTCYRLSRFFKRPTVKNAVLTGLCAGLALMSKMSALILIPITFFLFVLFLYWDRSLLLNEKNNASRGTRTVGIAALILYFLALGQKIIYVGLAPLCLTALSAVFFQEKSGESLKWRVAELLAWIGAYALGIVFIVMIGQKRELIVTLSAFAWMCLILFMNIYIRKRSDNQVWIFAAQTWCAIWFVATAVIILGYTDFLSSLAKWNSFHHYVRTFNIASTHVLGGHGGCVPGSFVTCDWKHFAASMSIRTPVATLLLAALGLFMTVRSNLSKTHRAVLFLPPLAFFLFSSFFNHIYLGIRHILPVYPFLFLFAGSVVPALGKLKQGGTRQVLTYALFMLLFFSLGKSFLNTPHQITYFNEFVKNLEVGAELMNAHAGQDNKRLAEAVKALHIPEIKIGGGNNNPPEFDYYRLIWAYMTDEDFTNPKPGYYALDIDVYSRQKRSNQNFWFRDKKPNHIAGKTMYLYQVS